MARTRKKKDSCPECRGSGIYIGAGTLPPEPCKTCAEREKKEKGVDVSGTYEYYWSGHDEDTECSYWGLWMEEFNDAD